MNGTLGGFVYFDELSEMNSMSKGMFVLGTLISILGIVILSSRAPPVGTRAERYGKLDGALFSFFFLLFLLIFLLVLQSVLI